MIVDMTADQFFFLLHKPCNRFELCSTLQGVLCAVIFSMRAYAGGYIPVYCAARKCMLFVTVMQLLPMHPRPSVEDLSGGELSFRFCASLFDTNSVWHIFRTKSIVLGNFVYWVHLWQLLNCRWTSGQILCMFVDGGGLMPCSTWVYQCLLVLCECHLSAL